MNLIPIIILACIFIIYQVKNGLRFGIVSLLILTYLGMGGAALVMEMFGEFRNVFPFAVEPMAYLSLSFVVIFWGFLGYKDDKLKIIVIDNTLLFKILGVVLFVGGLGAIAFFLPNAIDALTGNIGLNRINVEKFERTLGKFGIINSIFSLIANSFILSQVYAFIHLIPREGKRNPGKALLMLVSSLSYVIYIYAYVGRDGPIYWTMSFFFCFFLFKDFLLKRDLKKLKFFFALCLPLLVVPFILISISRFSHSPGGIGWSIVSYAGQQIMNFNALYLIDAPPQYGASGFPELYKVFEAINWVSKPADTQKSQFTTYCLNHKFYPWSFSTFVGHWLGDFGKVGTMACLLMLCIATRRLLRKVSVSGTLYFSNLVLFILFYQTVYWGVFYYRLYSANYYMLFMILLAIAFKTGALFRLKAVLAQTERTGSQQ